MTCVRDLLGDTGLPRLEAQMLLQHALGVPRSWLIAHDTDVLAADDTAAFHALEKRRLLGEPMAYILGVREFMGHDFQVSSSVLIPRPDTEVLVETAIQFIAQREPAATRVLDLGTGSGAIAISIALACPYATVVATDSSAEALPVAQANASRLGARVAFFQGSWYGALPNAYKPFDLIVSNPPYIQVNDPHLVRGDLRYEPSGALTDGADGLQALVQIIDGAKAWLAPEGGVWLEHGWDQAQAVRALLVKAGFNRVESRVDLAGIERISGGYL